MLIAITLLVLLALLISVEYENNVGATVTMLVTGVAAWWFYDFNIFTWIYQNFHVFTVFIAVYTIMGAVWARGKWEFFIRALKRDYVESDSYGKDTFFWRGVTQSIPPRIKDNKNSFILWMIYWPPSMLWTLINDPVRRLFSWVYHSMANSLQRASDNVFADVELKKKKEFLQE